MTLIELRQDLSQKLARAKQAVGFGATTNPGGAAKLVRRKSFCAPVCARDRPRRHNTPFEDEATERKMQ